MVGEGVGAAEGAEVGASDGTAVGSADGEAEGEAEGASVGASVGADEGNVVGAAVGTSVGDRFRPITQILKPKPCVLPSEWNANLVVPVTEMMAGNAVLLLVLPQYFVPPLTCR